MTLTDLHHQLLAVALSDEYRKGWFEFQAFDCPSYVPLGGKLGADWGVITEPDSSRFGLLTFEHDTCGCPDHQMGHEELPDKEPGDG